MEALEELDKNGYLTPNGDIMKPDMEAVKTARKLLEKIISNFPKSVLTSVDIDSDLSIQIYWRNDELRRAVVCGCYKEKIIVWYFDILDRKNNEKWIENDSNNIDTDRIYDKVKILKI